MVSILQRGGGGGGGENAQKERLSPFPAFASLLILKFSLSIICIVSADTVTQFLSKFGYMTYIKQLSCEIARNITWYLADEAVGRVG